MQQFLLATVLAAGNVIDPGRGKSGARGLNYCSGLTLHIADCTLRTAYGTLHTVYCIL